MNAVTARRSPDVNESLMTKNKAIERIRRHIEMKDIDRTLFLPKMGLLWIATIGDKNNERTKHRNRLSTTNNQQPTTKQQQPPLASEFFISHSPRKLREV